MIAKRPFGRTGHLSTVTIFGSAALMRGGKKEADRALKFLLEYGVNHIDTAPRYGDAELLIGPWMTEHRKDFFLATKTSKRTYAEAREEIQRSLERLRVDRVDLLQFHALAHPDEWDTVMGPGGALEAAVVTRGSVGANVMLAGWSVLASSCPISARRRPACASGTPKAPTGPSRETSRKTPVSRVGSTL